jgi:tetratricopeptide (TPR) repeat protein
VPDRHVRGEHGAYFARFVEGWGEQLRGSEGDRAARHIDGEHENIRAAWSWALESRNLERLKLFASHLTTFYEQRNRFREGAELFARTAAELLDGEHAGHAAVGYLLVGEGMLRSRLGEEDRSRDLARRGIDVLRPHGETKGMMRGFLALVLLEWFQGSFANAIAYCEEAVALARRENHPEELAVCLRLHGWVEFSAGNYRVTEAYAKEALSIHHELEDASGASLTLQPLGLAMLESERPAEAEEHFRNALRLARSSGARETEAWTLGHLGRALLAKGELIEAEACLLERLRSTQDDENPYLDVWSRVDLGRVLTAAGKHAQAEEQLRKGVALAAGLRSVLPMLAALGSLAELRAHQGQNEEAIALASRVAADPGCEHDVKRSAERVLDELRERVAEDVFARAEVRGRSSVVGAMVDELLSEESGHRSGLEGTADHV